jgi:transcriptional regulator with XRE-family HTH domain
MTEIGATLREARMRAHVDISEVEAATKIRAKYLRALENEEWSLLPGPTYVKSFLRSYAQYLGIDPRLLVEEYKLRHERLAENELHPIAPLGAERRSPARMISPGVVGAAIVVALVAILIVIGSLGGSGGSSSTSAPGASAAQRLAQLRAERHARTLAAARARRSKLAGERIRLELIPSGTVYVCLVDQSGKKLIPGRILTTASGPQVFTAHRFRVNVGNSQVTLRINGVPLQPPNTGSSVAYDLRPGVRPALLTAAQAPTCA